MRKTGLENLKLTGYIDGMQEHILRKTETAISYLTSVCKYKEPRCILKKKKTNLSRRDKGSVAVESPYCSRLVF